MDLDNIKALYKVRYPLSIQLSTPPSSCTLSGAATSCMGQPLVMPLLLLLSGAGLGGWEMHREQDYSGVLAGECGL